jgi:uncharacterized membrane protein YcaP (DUF421 family)
MLIAIMRFLGKRQIGEMQVSELITAFLLSELASQPLSSAAVPVSYAVVPIITLICLEIFFSFLPTKIGFLKKLVDSDPSIIIRKGKPDRRVMSRMRMSMEDLICELHLAGYSSPDEIEYAILEPNGKLAFFAKSAPPNVQGIAHPLIIDGKINSYALCAAGKSEKWLENELKKKKIPQESVFLMTADDGGSTKIITRNEVNK